MTVKRVTVLQHMTVERTPVLDLATTPWRVPTLAMCGRAKDAVVSGCLVY
jgi:hypothetical protein